MKIAATLAGMALVAAACSSNVEAPAEPPPETELVAAVASYDLAVGETRFIAGLLTPGNEFVSGGSATMRFSFLGEDEPEPGPEVAATFLAIPDEEPSHQHPKAGPASLGRGVYQAEVTFDRAGPWEVEVEATVDGRVRAGTAAFQVAEATAIPAVGEEALATENLTLEDEGDAPIGAIDSRGDVEGEIPDPELHDATIAGALEAGRPFVVVFATPVFCQSQFCGPITDMVEELRRDYGDRAEFIHVEIWRDFQGRVINEAAADWLLRANDLQEPWVFFVDADGVIRGRWDNVATRGEIEPFLEELPPLA